MRNIALVFLFVLITGKTFSQMVPAASENIPFIVTFGKDAGTSWGDDDFCQIFFFSVPASQTEPVYIRVLDPDTGGDYDEPKEDFNTITNFTVYGGGGCWSHNDAQNTNPIGNYKSGFLLAAKSFDSAGEYNNRYYSFGPLNPFEGEYVEKFDSRVFKVIAQGVSGNDGNLYRYFLSTSADENIPVEGGNVFTYEYSLRLTNNQQSISQIYPYIDNETISIEVSNFDWDSDGVIKVISIAKNGLLCKVSGEDNWENTFFPILEEEQNTSIEIQFIKNKKIKVVNNNVVIIVKNQYGVSLPFFVIPLGGAPVYTPKIRMKGIK